ncbi:MAG TPA: peroxiredoxin [Bacteroidota bacterium]|nr:peroxiredoxin [Bacteroidota bacterium]
MKVSVLVLGLIVAVTSVLIGQQPQVPKVGQAAPDFSLPYATKDSVGGTVKLSNLVGPKNIVLAFYPADWSGGCTKEVCTMRDNFSALSDLNAQIIGISGDYEYSHHEWAKSNNLPFMLASDHNHEVARSYASYNESTGYNKRTVFVIDKNGNIAYADLSYSVFTLDSFNKLKKALEDLH